MLILTRRPGEKINIGNDIEVIILDVIGNQIKIGIKAPRNVAVDREEIYLKKREEQTLGIKPRTNNSYNR